MILFRTLVIGQATIVLILQLRPRAEDCLRRNLKFASSSDQVRLDVVDGILQRYLHCHILDPPGRSISCLTVVCGKAKLFRI